jgi:adenylate cyclase class 2
MKTEFECRFVNIDPAAARKKLAAAGFVMTEPEHLLRRRIFDLQNIDGVRRWLRLRDEGNGVTLTLKLKGDLSRGVAAIKEVECAVGDFDLMAELLSASDLKCTAYEENKREKWLCENIEVCLDTWPGLSPFLEIEGDSEDAVRGAAAKLGFDWADAMFGNVMEVYAAKGLTLEDVHRHCTFANPPSKDN